jgi:hypothetical protein
MKPDWLKEALFAGQTANGFKLGTALSRGWFWERVRGCRIVYRGPSMDAVDFDGVLVVAEADAAEIALPDYVSHEPGQVYFYVVRCANGCGQIEQTLQAAVQAAIDGSGEIQKAGPNGVFGLACGRGRDGQIEINWGYCPIGQASAPQQMKVYSDSGTGEIDYQQPTATVPYKGRKFYKCRFEPAAEGRFLFAVRAVDAQANEHGDTRKIGIEVKNKEVETIEILDARIV